ncbi:MAG: hypothetical protein ACM34C_02450, partial [Syntrophaceae bacterium]
MKSSSLEPQSSILPARKNDEIDWIDQTDETDDKLEEETMSFQIKKAAVLGAGVMGANIAA